MGTLAAVETGMEGAPIARRLLAAGDGLRVGDRVACSSAHREAARCRPR